VSRTIAIFALLYFYVMSRKIVSLVLALLFALFAGFQYNDPDPWLWIGIYGYVAVTGFLAAAGKYWLLAITLGLRREPALRHGPRPALHRAVARVGGPAHRLAGHALLLPGG
jgi:hypothetical protein